MHNSRKSYLILLSFNQKSCNPRLPNTKRITNRLSTLGQDLEPRMCNQSTSSKLKPRNSSQTNKLIRCSQRNLHLAPRTQMLLLTTRIKQSIAQTRKDSISEQTMTRKLKTSLSLVLRRLYFHKSSSKARQKPTSNLLLSESVRKMQSL